MPLNGQALPEYRSSTLARPSRAEEAEAEAHRAHKSEQGHRRYRHERHGGRCGGTGGHHGAFVTAGTGARAGSRQSAVAQPADQVGCARLAVSLLSEA